MIAIPNGSEAAVEQALADLRAWRDRVEEFTLSQSAELDAERNAMAALTTELEKLRRATGPLEQQSLQLQQERDEALRELEMVLERSATVAEEASRQRRLFAAERAELEAELRAMRRVLMQQELTPAAESNPGRLPGASRAGLPSGPSLHRAPTVSASESIHSRAAPPVDSNGVADDVAAQFAALKHRRATAPAGRPTHSTDPLPPTTDEHPVR